MQSCISKLWRCTINGFPTESPKIMGSGLYKEHTVGWEIKGSSTHFATLDLTHGCICSLPGFGRIPTTNGALYKPVGVYSILKKCYCRPTHPDQTHSAYGEQPPPHHCGWEEPARTSSNEMLLCWETSGKALKTNCHNVDALDRYLWNALPLRMASYHAQDGRASR